MNFLAQMKNISIKQLASGDYSLDVTLRADDPSKELLAYLNEVNTNKGVVVQIGIDA